MVDGITGWEGAAEASRTTAPRRETLPGARAADDAQARGLIGFLESDQLVRERSRPLPRAVLTRRRRTLLWALRAAGIGLGAMVIYTFVAQLTG